MPSEPQSVHVRRDEPGVLVVEVGLSIGALQEAMEGVTDFWLTTGHSEYGIEVTVAVGNDDLTLTNQPDPLTAILNACRRFKAGERNA